ncbi:MAG: hypothetical protein A4E36_01766 [Methanoregulaceae archaeon PtaB.Bin009]|nr:MAG: hypothetical protein A4E36_01766 [Methanoregulaceae archaeon PtaB.Bin009]
MARSSFPHFTTSANMVIEPARMAAMISGIQRIKSTTRLTKTVFSFFARVDASRTDTSSIPVAWLICSPYLFVCAERRKYPQN